MLPELPSNCSGWFVCSSCWPAGATFQGIQMSRPFPLPSDLGRRSKSLRPSHHLYRAAVAHLRAHYENISPERAAKSLFADDQVTPLLLKAASAPATTTNPAWAQILAATAVDDSVQAITSLSAAAGLISRGLKVDFGGYASIRIPVRLVDPADAGAWVGEGMPAPVRTQRVTAGPTLTPHKLVVNTTYTNEMVASSNIENISRTLISEATALALDKAVFGTQADDGVTPGGILNGVTPITPTAGGGLNAMVGDIGKLIAALVAAGAGAGALLAMNPTQATTLSLLAGPKFTMPVLQSNSIAGGTVVAVEPTSFASAFDATPEFAVAPATALHMEDTNPVDVVAGSPTRSMFQVDSTALRMTLRAAWGLRAPHVAVINGATW